jgi:hypothetical protein
MTTEWKIEDLPAFTADDIDDLLKTSMSSIKISPIPTASITTGATGSSGSIYTSNGSNGTWINSSNTANSFWTTGATTTPYTFNAPNTQGLHVTSDAEFEGDIKWKGRSLGKMLEKIEDRLAIIQDPDPKKLEKFAALKKAYDNYKLLEKLIGDDYKDDTTK